MEMPQGLIFSIQRFSIQDGPGIRSTVFFKGCPLSCKWCSNPESQQNEPELMHRFQNCQKCRACIEVCPTNAIAYTDQQVKIDRKLCDNCFDCIDVCCSGALETTGQYVSLDEVIDEVCRDELYYRNSEGGVTLSGGEPLMQAEFALELLKRLKSRSIDTTIDTCGHAPWSVFESVLPFTDRFLFDLKQLDPNLHRSETGISNDLIIANLDQLLKNSSAEIWIRVPVISGFNDNQDYFTRLKDLLKGRKIHKISLLTYHKWGTPKYQYLGREYPWHSEVECPADSLEKFKSTLTEGGFDVTIGF